MAENKSKDFCFLFYPGDYLRDTQCLSERTQVVYDKIMCEHMRALVLTEERLKSFTKHLTDDERSELVHVLEQVEGGYCIQWVATSVTKRKGFVKSREDTRNGSDTDMVRVFIIRDDVRGTYKIGVSKNPFVRYNELNTTYKLIWYSEPIMRSESNFLHERFKERNVSGDWFALTKEDLKALPKISQSRTSPRTEKEKEIVIEKESIIIKEKTEEIFEKFRVAYKGTKRAFDVEFDAFKAKHKDYREAVSLLMSALDKEIAWRNRQVSAGVKFIPEWKHLKTWLYQRCWTQELKEVKNNVIIATAPKVVATVQTKAQKAGLVFPDFYDEDFEREHCKDYIDFTQDYWNHLQKLGFVRDGHGWIRG